MSDLNIKAHVMTMVEKHFRIDTTSLNPDTPIQQMGNEDSIDEFYDEVGEVLDKSFFMDDQEKFNTPTKIMGCLEQEVEKKEQQRRDDLARNWRDQLSGLQKLLLKVAPFLGFAIFFLGIQLKVRGKPNGEALMGLGMFISVQMLWGVQSIYGTIAQKAPAMLEKFGYSRFFWIILIAAYAISFIGIGLVLSILGFENLAAGF